MRICVTGASGFVGKALCAELLARNFIVRAVTQCADDYNVANTKNFEVLSVGDIGLNTNWNSALNEVDCIIHCAARAHGLYDDCYRVNALGTKRLAEEAAKLGVKRLILLSTIKVNGERTASIQDESESQLSGVLPTVFTEQDSLDPSDTYALSKLHAERAVLAESKISDLEVVIVRPPIVYGPHVKGNLSRLMKLVGLGVPLPVKGVANKRSMIGIDNLIDFLICCSCHPAAAGKTFLVSDGEDLSTCQLLERIGRLIETPLRSFYMPTSILYFLGKIFGKAKEINSLIGSLVIDSSYAKLVLEWRPPVTLEEGLRRMTKASSIHLNKDNNKESMP